jgi:hypothetical protein
MLHEQPNRSARWPEHLGVTVLLLVAALLRSFRLGHWGLKGDEIFTLRDSLTTAWPSSAKDLLFCFNYHLIRPWTELDELSLRLLPALFGIVSVPALYWLTRCALNRRAALFGAILLTFNPTHVLRSQQARYWSLVFLLSAIYVLAIYIGLRDRKPLWTWAGIVCFGLAALAHPTGAFPMGGLLVWLVTVQGIPDRIRGLGRHRVLGWLVIVAPAVAIGLMFTPRLIRWIEQPHMPRLEGVSIVLSHASALSLEMSVLGFAGIVWLWWNRERSLAVLMAGAVAVPCVALFGLSYVTAVSTAYLFATAPFFFVGAGVFLDRLAASIGAPRNRLAVGPVLVVLLVAAAPGLVSHYRDGSREDYRAAAAFLEPRVDAADLVVSDEVHSLEHYLQRTDVVQLERDEAFLEARRSDLSSHEHLWLVVRTSRRGGFRAHKLGLGKAARWIYANCRIRSTLGVNRLDFRHNELQLYRCSPRARPGSTSEMEESLR